MIKYVHKGYTVLYDETFQPGDLIIAYRKGYHEFIKYEDRGKTTAPLIYYKTIYNFNGKKCNSKTIHTCDAAYCRHAKDHIIKSIQDKETEIGLLKDIIYPPNN